MEDLLLIGVIAGPFGVKGQLKLKAFTDRPDHIRRRVHTLYLQVGKQRVEHTLTSLHEHKPGLLILTLKGIADRDAADELRGAEVYISAADAAPLDTDEYFLHELVGLAVSTADGQPVGTVREILETGAGEVLVITRPGQADALVPMVREFIASLDIPAGQVVITPVEGLL
jgi:16S rRNA processing protein RimM